MNRRIIRVYGFLFACFLLLAGFTAYWSVIDADSLKAQKDNRRPLLKAQKVERGSIRGSDGTVIARSVPVGSGESRRYVRRYPLGARFGHPIGYSFVSEGNSEFERFHNETLIGERFRVSSLIDEFTGRRPVGDDITTSLDPEAQRVALEALGGQPGAVVALEPRTGKVLVAASLPSYDPNLVPGNLEQLNRDPTSPLLDRATQGQYPPGSTFKVVTAAAALDSGEITPDSLIDSPASLTVQGQPLANSGNVGFGSIDVSSALTSSVNTFFSQLGERVGQETLFDYMERFGFNQKPEIDLPRDELSVSGVFSDGKPLGSGDPVDVARIAIGQERLLVTPLQMAEVAATVANGGVLMKPRIWARVRDQDGRTVKRMEPQAQSRVISTRSAAQLTAAMESVVNEGTGTSAALAGIPVAGKTGTAEVPDRAECQGLPNQAWFIGFAPADDPQVAVAATVECTAGQGGTVAAPIAAAVMRSLTD